MAKRRYDELVYSHEDEPSLLKAYVSAGFGSEHDLAGSLQSMRAGLRGPSPDPRLDLEGYLRAYYGGEGLRIPPPSQPQTQQLDSTLWWKLMQAGAFQRMAQGLPLTEEE